MTNQEIYAYIYERMDLLTDQEKTFQRLGLVHEATACIIVKNELLDFYSFIKANERKLKP